MLNLRSPIVAGRSFLRYRALIWQMARQEVISRYRGSMMGVLWALAHPVMLLSVYTFIFHLVFKAQWTPGGESSAEYALQLFAGLIVCSVFSECVNRAPTLILNHVNYVKKVVFPLEVLPLVLLGGALFRMSVSLLVLLLFYAASHLSLNWTTIIFPLLVMPLALFSLGVSWFLASVGVFVRDVGHAITVVTNLMLFLAPVFYPISALPEAYRPFMYLNPLTFVVEQSRDVLIAGKLPSWYGLGMYSLCSIVVAWFGLVWFERTRKGFADVL
ncbi:MAG: ABC transporter permease [Nitrospira sp.]